ncbi:Serine/threonine-protein phosphatase with EF-hands 1 [Fukomys damarensis]|uniref:Serine/threonine-protein phosphatase with EF-hands 1 n=1 Tax=Fukomys damarensis TaxID=885580 RepID=A0A091D398_FUKDA|nr:Serine/threonine-protein phosphatase with EF-hands 1 [Fukomys damarensis]
MGCGNSCLSMRKSERAVKAALIIQNWYRGYRARLRARQQYALAVFESIEYADEQSQMQLSDFFSFMLENYTHMNKEDPRDLHGKLDDLFLIFYKNGLPSGDNPYLFNGDFIDRGRNSIEVLMILLDYAINLTYQKSKTYLSSYLQLHGKKILQTLEDFYTWLPIGAIIDNETLVIHGGISESTDLKLLHRIERNKMKSVLLPPVSTNSTEPEKKKVGAIIMSGIITSKNDPSEQLSKQEWEQIIDILWSDPRGTKGCFPNTGRGGGCYFGPDITTNMLNKYHLKRIIRSHECRPEGYEICHNGKVITVFSASNYYENGSNRGAYIKMGYGMALKFSKYQITNSTCMQPLHQRVSAMESSAIRILKEKMISRKTDLIHAFQLRDYSKSGQISMEEFRTIWKLFSSHYNVQVEDSQIDELANTMDLNKDGSIDFNEFLKAFYVVHKYDQLNKSNTKHSRY